MCLSSSGVPELGQLEVCSIWCFGGARKMRGCTSWKDVCSGVVSFISKDEVSSIMYIRTAMHINVPPYCWNKAHIQCTFDLTQYCNHVKTTVPCSIDLPLSCVSCFY